MPGVAPGADSRRSSFPAGVPEGVREVVTLLVSWSRVGIGNERCAG